VINYAIADQGKMTCAAMRRAMGRYCYLDQHHSDCCRTPGSHEHVSLGNDLAHEFQDCFRTQPHDSIKIAVDTLQVRLYEVMLHHQPTGAIQYFSFGHNPVDDILRNFMEMNGTSLCVRLDFPGLKIECPHRPHGPACPACMRCPCALDTHVHTEHRST